MPSSKSNRQKTKRPSIEILELNKNIIRFVLSGVDLSVANSLRRIILSEIPTMAFDFVDFRTNDSYLSDEMLSHRFGLVPLISDSVDKFNYARDCTCEMSCPLCSVQYSLKMTSNEGIKSVYSSDICNLSMADDVGHEVNPIGSQNSSMVDLPSSTNFGNEASNFEQKPILLLKLAKNCRIDCLLAARKGIAKEHAKWQCVSVCSLQNDPNIQLDTKQVEQLKDSQKRSFVRKCPRNVYSFDENTKQLYVKNPRRCTYCDECTVEASKLHKPTLVRVQPEQNKFVFYVESVGSLPPETIVSTAFTVLIKKLELLSDRLNSNEPDQINNEQVDFDDSHIKKDKFDDNSIIKIDQTEENDYLDLL